MGELVNVVFMVCIFIVFVKVCINFSIVVGCGVSC